MDPVKELLIVLEPGLTPFAKFDEAYTCDGFYSFIGKFVANVIALLVFRIAFPAPDVVFRCMAFDFPQCLIPAAPFEDGFPCLLP